MNCIANRFNQVTPAGQPATFDAAFDCLCDCLGKAAAKTDNLDKIEPEIRLAFKEFLRAMDMPLALKNFDSLLQEKSGEKFRRNDGTVNWYHEFIPLLMVMSLIRKGHEKNGIDLADIDQHGGLEVLICTHLRHDSVEDHKKSAQLKRELYRMENEIVAQRPNYDRVKLSDQVRRIRGNIGLMTQKIIHNPDGTSTKEDVRNYTARMLNSNQANPIVFILKQADIIVNFATMLGAPKFTPDRRLKRCNEREDMYGPRYGFADLALRRWPRYTPVIKTLDAMMGMMIYPQFRYLESVDLQYKTPSPHPVGIHRFLNKALGIPFPDQKLNPLHIFLNRMCVSVDPAKEPDKYGRLRQFLDRIIKPSLAARRECFPYLFNGTRHRQPAAQPPAPC